MTESSVVAPRPVRIVEQPRAGADGKVASPHANPTQRMRFSQRQGGLLLLGFMIKDVLDDPAEGKLRNERTPLRPCHFKAALK